MSTMKIDPLGMALHYINGRPLTDELLEEVLKWLLSMEGIFDAEKLAEIRSQLETTIGVTHAVGEVMRQEEHLPWVSDVKGIIQWHYWDSYKKLLSSNGRAGDIVRVLDQDTDNILTECGNPKNESPWKMRGLVMGDVQSGKTASYTGLIAKAADAGYKVIILLTGMIEDLRKQTQERLDEGFVGLNSSDVLSTNKNMRPIGAGKYRAKSANVLTSTDFDFLTTNANVLRGIPLSNINEPVLFVMKKNKFPLENLVAWLTKQMPEGDSVLRVPLLLLDDEADNASVNAKKDEDPATINRLIREALAKFRQSSYVAYTATPFANIFINPENDTDLFPSDFIYSLNTPSNYIGASSIFLEDGAHYSQLNSITDAESIIPYKHKKDLDLKDIPDSLKDAVRVFFLSCAVRDLRKESLRHRSMLVNVSRFTAVQSKVAEKLRVFSWNLKEEIKQFLLGSSWESHADLVKLRQLWDEEFGLSKPTWDEVRHALNQSIASVEVVTINQQSLDTEKLNYSQYRNSEKGRRVIAVGGLTLSRGLTLEGLCVSYFYRNSKAYDTLLQMGRWFGYRPGYEDLFRIWMDDEAQDWYAHIATAVNELRTDFRRMSAKRMPPSSFGIRVKSHPDTLIVTAQNKMRNSQEIVRSISFTAYGTETAYVPKSEILHQENIDTVISLVKSEGPALKRGSRFLWKGVDKSRVAGFLSDLNISNMNAEFLPDPDSGVRPLIDFIANNNFSDLKEWDISIPQGKGSLVADISIPLAEGGTESIGCRERQFETVPKGSDYLKLNKQRVGDTSDEMVELTAAQIDIAKNMWEAEREKDPKKGVSIPGYIYRRVRTKPLLTIHFIECVPPSPEMEKKKPGKMMKPEEVGVPAMVAVSLSFPDFDPRSSGEKVIYRLNKVAINEVFGEETDDDED